MILLASKEDATQHLLSLPAEDRYTRFCATVSDDFIRNYVETAKGFFYGLYLPDEKNLGRKTCVALLHIVYNRPVNLEVAVSVLPEYRGHGYGKRLMYFAMGIAEAYQVDNVTVSGISSNAPMVKLAKSCGYDVSHEYGEFGGECGTISADMRSIMSNTAKLFQIFTRSYK